VTRTPLEVAEKCNLEIEFGGCTTRSSPAGILHPRGYLRSCSPKACTAATASRARRRRRIHRGQDAGPVALPCLPAPRPPVATPPSGRDRAGSPTADAPACRRPQGVSTGSKLELGVIEKTGFVSYFLIVGDFVRHGRAWASLRGARFRRRFLVTYLLEIANVDPIRYGLLFERFLNPERVNPPDIDIDFADDRRADVIEYVRENTARCVAQIITFGTMGAKSVIRDVGRVMGLSYGDCDRLAKMIPAELKMTSRRRAQAVARLQEQAYETRIVTRN
jgi:DNA polymerase III alpha subunit